MSAWGTVPSKQEASPGHHQQDLFPQKYHSVESETANAIRNMIFVIESQG